jgi:hypothetical protein
LKENERRKEKEKEDVEEVESKTLRKKRGDK